MKTENKRQHLGLILIITVLMLSLVSFTIVLAENNPNFEEITSNSQDQVCPSGDGWTKIDLPPLDPTSGEEITSYTVNAPSGQLIIQTCYKSTHADPVYDPSSGSFDPGKESYTFTSTIKNQNGQTQALSHVSYKLSTSGPTPPTPTPPSPTPPSPTPPSPTPPSPTPGPAKVSYVIDCLCSEGESSSHTITFNITGAIVYLYDRSDTLLGTFTEPSGSHSVEEGYYYTWVADATHAGASDKITIEALDPCCEEAPKEQPSITIEDPWCEWTENKSIYHAEWTLTGALFSITGEGYAYGPTGTSGKTTLDVGLYEWSWENDPAYAEAGGGGIWDLTEGCEPGKAAISLNHVCNYVDGQSVNTVNLTVNNATLTFDGKDYTENTTLKLSSGDYPWSWVSSVNESETDSGLLTLGTCPPKTEEEKPDVAAGGLGPSFIASAAPALLTVSGLGLAWTLIKNRAKKTN